jgi:hypothetical protein
MRIIALRGSDPKDHTSRNRTAPATKSSPVTMKDASMTACLGEQTYLAVRDGELSAWGVAQNR